MSHDEIVSVVQSHKAGKTIQYKVKGGSIWYECPGFPSWNFDGLDYRVKPAEPREWCLEFDPVTRKVVRDHRILAGQHPCSGPSVVHVREVLD